MNLVKEFVNLTRHEIEKAEDFASADQWEAAVDEMQMNLPQGLIRRVLQVIEEFCPARVKKAVAEMRKYDEEALFDLLHDSNLYPAGQWDLAGPDAAQASFYAVLGQPFRLTLGTQGNRKMLEELDQLVAEMEPDQIDEAIEKVLEDTNLRWTAVGPRREEKPLNKDTWEWSVSQYIRSIALTKMAIYFYVDEEAVLAAIEEYYKPVEHAEETIIYTFKDGFYACELSVAELRKEGREMGNCVARDDIGHPQAVRDGTERIFSIRTPAGKPKFDVLFQHSEYHGQRPDLQGWKVREVKGKGNRLPGFEPGKARVADFVKPDEVEKCSEFIMNYLGYTHAELHDIQDLLPGLLALEEWKKARAEKEAKEKADKAAKRGTKNPGRRRISLPARIPISAKVARLANQVHANDPDAWPQDEY